MSFFKKKRNILPIDLQIYEKKCDTAQLAFYNIIG